MPVQQRRPSLFLLIGQSNMAGRGKLTEVPELEDPRVFMFRDGKWLPAKEPLHRDKPEAGIGLGMSFALKVIETGGATSVGLVPCAVGGSPLSRWMPDADLFKKTLSTARTAQKSGCLTGILWHQGENDSGNFDDAASYGERFNKIVCSLRSELNAGAVPVIAGELGLFLQHRTKCEFFGLVNRQLRELESVIPAYACATAENLQDNGDTLHFSAVSLREFGIRYAKRFEKITQKTEIK